MSGWLFLVQQMACAFSILVALGFCAGLRRPSVRRLLIVSFCSGLAALTCTQALLRPVTLALIILFAPAAAWPGVPRSLRGRMRLTCLALSLLMTGTAQLLHAFSLSHTPLILSLVLLLPLAARLLPTENQMQCVTVEITHAAHRLELTALIDSGNLLRDPLTRLPVIVMSRRAASRLIPLPAPGELSPGMRFISVRTAAGSALMPIFRPTGVRLLLPDGWQDVHAVIGLSPDGYSGFQALVPSGVISTAQGGIPLCP